MAVEIAGATDIYDYLDKWYQNNGILDVSNTEELTKFMEGLGREIDKLSATVNEADKLILYGGWNGDVPMWQIAKGASESGQGFFKISNFNPNKLLGLSLVILKNKGC